MVYIYEVKNYSSWEANSYVLYDDEGNCILVDPSHFNEDINDFIASKNLKVKALVLTHAHFDHITAVDYYIEKYHCEFMMHWQDEKLLKDTYKNCSWMIDEEITVESKPTRLLEDKETIDLLDKPIEIIHTPYHTAGGICLFIEDANILISGDSLFRGGTGRTDLPTGSTFQMFKSLAKLKILPKGTKVYPGHGENTTIGEEL